MLRGREFQTTALTLYQPWASLMALGLKRIETRSWSTTHRGLLAIHSSRTFHKSQREFARSDIVQAALAAASVDPEDALLAWPRGVVLCTVELLDVFSTDRIVVPQIELGHPEIDFGDFSPGRFAWNTFSVHRFQRPVYAVGQRGLWTWEHSGSQLRPTLT